MHFGVHISGAGGLEYIPEKAAKLGCETFQFFSRSPRGGKSVLKADTATAFRSNAEKFCFKHYYIHAPYFINLASQEARIYEGSIEVLRDELERARALGARGVITHIGSAKGMTHQEALGRVIGGAREVLSPSLIRRGSGGGVLPSLFLEISAGAGDIIGSTLEELHKIYSSSLSRSFPLKIALDTAHAFASGYDIRTGAGLGALLDEYDEFFGIEHLEVVHVNDSKVGLGERKDRHEHIGKGKIGLEALRAFVNEKRLKNICAILETPKDSDTDDLRNLATLRSLVD